MSEQEVADSGVFPNGETLFERVFAKNSLDYEKEMEQSLTGMFTSAYPREKLKWVIEQNLKTPRELIIRLFLSCATNDWRQIIPRINIPTLVITGKAGIWEQSQYWVGSQITGSQVVAFEEEEGGSHFMFMENPEKFNVIIAEFIG